MDSHIILIVDDEPNIPKSLKRLLMETDYKVLTADSGESALVLLEKCEAHLVISDYRMPGMNGVEFLAKVKEKYPATMRLILSGFADAAAVVEAINDGQVYKFMPKPWNDQELLTTIKRAFEQYDLQQENANLNAELHARNRALEEMMGNLEEMVAERTRDIEMKNKALKITHNILDMLPIGVIGIDLTEMVVYMNGSLGQFLSTQGIALGSCARSFLDSNLMDVISEAMNTGEQKVHFTSGDNCVICTPLPGQTGVIGTFVKCMKICEKKENITIQSKGL
jgi:FixJ family two-component response regulator